ncbi:MAG: YbhB/YbcL family Raf kinase inhibitor-like protein [Desulfatibacillaceae bacterium]
MAANLVVQSKALKNGKAIPKKYTAQGEDTSPNLSWSGAPKGTKSFVVIVDDPDAPSPRIPVITFVHWVVYDIPANVKNLPAAVPAGETLASGAKQGKNSWGKNAYGGPNPPFGEHRYRFKVYALDTMLGLDPAKTKKKHVVKAMKGHVLAEGSLMGTYEKKK